jgi:hypothetical protein
MTRGVAALALGYAALLVATEWIAPWELFHDELYYWAGAQHLALGYVDHPPLAPWLLAAATAVLGDGRLAFALIPAVCGAGTILLTARMARRLGAGGFGQVLAGACVMAAPVFLTLFSFYSVNAIEILLWTAATCLLVERIHAGDARLWLGIGAIAGVSLLDKHTFALLAAGLAAGVVATPLRADLRTRWPWLGAGIALAVASPNLVWNALHGWPSLAFYASRPLVDLPATPAQALEIQILALNPLNLLVCVPGAVWLLASRRGRAFRPFGVAFVALLAVILMSGHRRGDRIAGIYPIVMAAGGAFWDGWRGRGHRLARAGVLALVLAAGALAAPAVLPILQPEAAGRYLGAIAENPEIETGDVDQALPLFLTGRLEWRRFADEVIAAWRALPDGVRDRSVVLAPHWVYASVVEYHGRGAPLPPVVAPHNAYWFRRHEAAGRDAVLAVGIPPERLAPWFAEVREVARFRCGICTVFRRDAPIVLATGPVRPLEDLLREWRHFGVDPAPALTARAAVASD